jgi:transposase-like protein
MVSSMPKSRPPYPEEFRREAVQMVRGGRAIPDVATSLGVTEQSLRTWSSVISLSVASVMTG